MSIIIIADTSCLILLDNIGEIDLLQKLFKEVTITSIVADEFGKPIPDWMKIKDAVNQKYFEIILASLDKGEASSIALAVEQEGSLLILDDQKARKFAAEMGLKYTGTLALIIEAKFRGYISLVKPIIDKIKDTNFRMSPELEKKILELADE